MNPFYSYQFSPGFISKIRNLKNGALAPEEIDSILILKGDHLGDLICATPAVYSVKKAFPNARITLASHQEGIRLYQALNLFDDFIDYTSPILVGISRRKLYRFIKSVRKRKYDLVINLRHDVRDILAGLAMGSRFYCTYDHKHTAFFASHQGKSPDDFSYEGKNHLNLVEAIGVKQIQWQFPFDQQAQKKIDSILPKKPIIAIHPFARTSAKQWPIDRFLKVAEYFEKQGCCVVWLGGKKDRESGEKLASKNKAINLAGKLSFEELFAFLHRAELFLGIDSFVMHAAYLIGVKGIAIFSGTNNVKRWAPPGFTVLKIPVPCEPCQLERCNVAGHPCLDKLTDEDVISEIDNVFKTREIK